MNYIEKVKISGFWGDKDISINFNIDINFLIGVNGSGKTTVINMVAAALNADFPTLDRLPFRKLSLQLKEVNGNKKPSIQIEKKIHRESPYPSIIFSIKDKASSDPVVYHLDDLEEERIFRAHTSSYYRDMPLRYRGSFGKLRKSIMEHLNTLVNVSWLSIHRTTAPYRFGEEKSFESSIDQKLNELSDNLIRYFSFLDKQSAAETAKFQQTIFLSLVSVESEEEVFSLLRSLDFKEEKQALIEIFKLFKLDEKKFSAKIKKHFDSYADAFETLNVKDASLSFESLTALIGTKRIHAVVQDWNKLTEKQNKIYRHRNVFLNVINSLIQKKEIQINDRNELEVLTQSGKKFPLKFLSSGEKQLLIILGEALLQRSAPWVYIADEPELSLHVTWQESLVRNLKKINPNAQIVFATHSPDIVSTYEDSVVDMEKIVS
jgi:predicted ATP-dependent endonuclease of OLD family